MVSYDDLRLVALLSLHGDVRRTGAELRTHVATVYRHLKTLDEQLGAAVFERVNGRYVPTVLGQALVEAAGEVDHVLGVLDRRLASEDGSLRGEIVVTTTDSLTPLVARALVDVRAAQPGLAFRLSISNTDADMSRREADVAIRPTRAPPETLVGRKLGEVAYAVFEPVGGVADDAWIGLDDSLSAIPAAVWAAEVMTGAPIARVNSMWGAAQAVAAGLGRAVLPTYLAEGLAMRAAAPPVAELNSAVWLLYHPDQKRNPRVRAFSKAVAPSLGRLLAAAL
jgi:DNA-binding transcriptional LysR family regulator